MQAVLFCKQTYRNIINFSSLYHKSNSNFGNVVKWLLSKQIEKSLKRVERERERLTRCNRYSYHDRSLTVRPKTSFYIVIQESTLEQTINGQALPCLHNMEIYFYCQMTRHFYDIKNHKNQIPVKINFGFNLLPHFAYFFAKNLANIHISTKRVV